MISGRTKLTLKNIVKQTYVGKKLRDKYQRRGASSRYNAEKLLIKYLGNDICDNSKQEIIDDMIVESTKYDFAFYEYMMYRFYDMSSDERREYVSALERTSFCERMNNMKNVIIFDDKGRTYDKYKDYYKRDLISIFSQSVDDFKVFLSFVKKHPRFIIKPFDGACGHGVKIIDVKNKDLKEEFKRLLKEYRNGYVAEELIVQCKELSAFHPESVNTVRITTILYKDRVDIIHPFFRTGRGGSVVDNGGSGGIINAIDADTGIIIGSVDEMGIYYESHPESKLPLIGYKMPKWEDAKKLAIELAHVMPDNHYCGWDLALTDEGWVLQEANDRGEFVGFQLPTKQGFRKELMQILSELGV